MSKTLIFAIAGVLLFNMAALGAAIDPRAEELFLKGDYDSAINECRNFISRYPSAGLARIYYIEGISSLKLEQYADAKSALNLLILKYPNSNLAIGAKIGLADAYFMEADFANAAISYEGLLKLTKKPDQAPQIYFKLAKAYQKLGRFEEAKDNFKKVRDGFPLCLESRYAADSLKDGDFFFTVQVGAFVDKANAQRLCDKVKEKGFEGYVSEYETKEKIYYRVRVGKFEKREEALDMADKLNERDFWTRIFP